MIAIHLFNLSGYNFLFCYYISQSDKEVVQRLDNNQFSQSELVEVKVKLNLPYMTAFGEYERIDGEYELDGQYYKYVQRKILNDTLFLLCLPDYSKNELVQGKIDYAGKTTEMPSKDGQASSIKKGTFTGEYGCQMKPATVELFPVMVTIFTPIISTELADIFIDSDCQPPESIA